MYKQYFKESIPQENIKRGVVSDIQPWYSGKLMFGNQADDFIGHFNNSDNPIGWDIYKSDFDKKEFGSDVFRIYSKKTKSSTVVKFNLQTGIVYFLDSELYANYDEIKWVASKYKKIFIKDTPKAMKEFGVI